MSIQSDLHALLTGIVAADQIYPVSARAPVQPYIVYQRVSAVPENVLAGNGGNNPLINTRLQIDVYATLYGEAQAKAQAIKDALRDWPVQNVTNSEQDFFEDGVNLHRVMIDISTWHN
ncbi:DUF3168 domain-containing protein [Noviherbaspirillum suwonense]|jgi:hypothetical protein|uniref:DUF3168 domain-containing protein n=1 Tax=Noviherbaspirillum suwonense TaxID=1224511 RepID=A0ABY1QHW2_9BURK|nr:DUF3168 domain-containing protein [Noviherbaspirillum suwonense]SMP71967.1 Protein of unknown function [Noviherbaspirillum suwonense]